MKTQDIRNMGLAYLKVQEGNTAVNKQDQDGADKKEEVELDEATEVGKAGPAKLVSYGPKGDKVTASKIADHIAKRANDYTGGNAELVKKLSSEVAKHGDTTANELIGKHKTIAKNVGMDAKAAHNLISGAASALKEEVELDEAGSYRDQGAQNMMKASRKADKEADKVRAQRDKDEAKKKKEETAVKKLTKEDTAEWPIFARIQEKLSYKVSGVGDDPHEIIVKFAKDQHTKGATPGEKIDSKASSGEKDFVKLHGGLMGNPSTVDGHKAAAHTASAATAGIKTSPGRPGDSKIGDKNIPKSGGNK